MPRSIRIECPSAFYHVMERGNRWEQIFRSVSQQLRRNRVNARR